MRIRPRISVSFLASLLYLAGGPVSAARCVFVNGGNPENHVNAFTVDRRGVLQEAPGSPYPTGGAGGVYATRSMASFDSFLYVLNTGGSLMDGGSVAGFRIGEDCGLDQLDSSPWMTGTTTSGIAADRSTRSLFISSWGDHDILRFRISEAGDLSLADTTPVGADQGPFDLKFDGDRRILIATHQISASLGTYSVDRSGFLTAAPGSPFHQSAMFLSALSVNKDATRAYALDSRNATIHGLALAPDGTASRLPGSGWRMVKTFGGPDARDLRLTGGDRVALVSNRSGMELLAFRIDANGVVHVPAFRVQPTGPLRPFGMDVAPEGHLLAVTAAGGPECGNNCVATFRLNRGVVDGPPLSVRPIGYGSASSVIFASSGAASQE